MAALLYLLESLGDNTSTRYWKELLERIQESCALDKSMESQALLIKFASMTVPDLQQLLAQMTTRARANNQALE